VNPVHNAPARAPPLVLAPPVGLVLHRALPSPTRQNTPQGTNSDWKNLPGSTHTETDIVIGRIFQAVPTQRQTLLLEESSRQYPHRDRHCYWKNLSGSTHTETDIVALIYRILL
jgi:hypothetical protein